MLQRLESKKPHYSHAIWERDRVQNLAYLKNISAYPDRFLDDVPKKKSFADEASGQKRVVLPAIHSKDSKIPREGMLPC